MLRKIIIISSFLVFIGTGLYGCASPQRETTHSPAHVFGQAKDVFRQALQTGVKKSPLPDRTRSAMEKGTNPRGERLST